MLRFEDRAFAHISQSPSYRSEERGPGAATYLVGDCRGARIGTRPEEARDRRQGNPGRKIRRQYHRSGVRGIASAFIHPEHALRMADGTQAKAFEANDVEDTEETNELDDDELNELLARGDHELETFAEMDRERNDMKTAQWQAEGHKGALPPPLMQESELPPFYRRDIGEELASNVALDDDQGRGRRAKAEVRYTDGLTDDQWIMAMENSDDDVDEAAIRKRKRADKKQERKRMNHMLAQAEAEGKPLQIKTLQEEAVSPPPTASKKKRGRPSKSATPSMLGDDLPTVSTTDIPLLFADPF